jgi:phosphoglycerol transferase MdoB-like AlkP superfamily enzyme
MKTEQKRYVHSWMYSNFIDFNIMIYSESKQYSDKFKKKIIAEDDLICKDKNDKVGKKVNIILLMIESLSSYHSKYFSGINDWTPNLDKIAKKNISFKNFFANGFTTEDAEISLLTGKFPIFKPESFTGGGGISFNGFFNVENSLPKILKKYNYSCEFLTTADLSFANTGKWADSIGFDYIEGDKHSYYNNFKRFNFNAAPDEALYHRVLNRVNHYKNNNNFFIFVKTVSTHNPLIHPKTGSKDEEAVFKYADKQLGLFYKKLKSLNFFDNGVLIIVGDHHSMTPLKREDIKVFGYDKAVAMVPMVVSFGDKINKVYDDYFQQVDIYQGIRNIVSDRICFSKWVGDIFAGISAKYIIHKRGDRRNIITVFEKEKIYSVKLDGDSTNTLKYKNEEIINKINAVRITNYD